MIAGAQFDIVGAPTAICPVSVEAHAAEARRAYLSVTVPES